jgi:hypothetical protein
MNATGRIENMKRVVTGSALAVAALALVAGRPAGAQDLQQKVAAAKQAATQNQQALRSYRWVEQTEIALKGEVKNTKLQSCVYGADGKVIKTPVSQPATAAKEESGGRPGRRGGRVKAKVVENKKEEMKEDMEAAVALVHQYVPPAPDKIQAAMAAGKITVTPGAAANTLRIADYAKAGDALVLTLDAEGKGIKKIDVDTWKDSPSDKVTLDVGMQSLPDGTSYAGTIVLAVPSSKIEVRITNSQYQKLTQ